MPAYTITYKHSAMKPDYTGKAIKYAQSPEDAAKFLGKYNKRAKTILDGRGNLLSNVNINEI